VPQRLRHNGNQFGLARARKPLAMMLRCEIEHIGSFGVAGLWNFGYDFAEDDWLRRLAACSSRERQSPRRDLMRRLAARAGHHRVFAARQQIISDPARRTGADTVEDMRPGNP
jgi:hypothetical protein